MPCLRAEDYKKLSQDTHPATKRVQNCTRMREKPCRCARLFFCLSSKSIACNQKIRSLKKYNIVPIILYIILFYQYIYTTAKALIQYFKSRFVFPFNQNKICFILFTRLNYNRLENIALIQKDSNSDIQVTVFNFRLRLLLL